MLNVIGYLASFENMEDALTAAIVVSSKSSSPNVLIFTVHAERSNVNGSYILSDLIQFIFGLQNKFWDNVLLTITMR